MIFTDDRNGNVKVWNSFETGREGVRMIDIYVGVTFDCRLPDTAVNTKIKQVVSLLSAYFNCRIHAQIFKASSDDEKLKVKENDYYLHFSTESLNPLWTEQIIEYARVLVKNIMRCEVEKRVHEPFGTPLGNGIYVL